MKLNKNINKLNKINLMNIKIINKNKIIFIYLNKKLFFQQKFLYSNNNKLSNALYTYFYVILVMERLGYYINN